MPTSLTFGPAMISRFALTIACFLLSSAIIAAEEKPFHIQAHRGAGIAKPENTLEAFEYSWSIGVTPEADLRTTSDGVIVCFHDANLARVVSGVSEAKKQTSVEKLPAKEVLALEVGSFRGDEFHGQKVPTLKSIFAAMQGHPERLLYLDIKTADQDQLVKLIAEYEVTPQVIYTTTHHDLIQKWKQLVPGSLTLLWNGGSEEKLKEKLADVRAADFEGITHLQIHVRVGDLTREDPFTPSTKFLEQIGKELKQHGIVFQVLPWECQDQEAYVRLLELGVESFATDYPEVTLEGVKEFRSR